MNYVRFDNLVVCPSVVVTFYNVVTPMSVVILNNKDISNNKKGNTAVLFE